MAWSMTVIDTLIDAAALHYHAVGAQGIGTHVPALQPRVFRHNSIKVETMSQQQQARNYSGDDDEELQSTRTSDGRTRHDADPSQSSDLDEVIADIESVLEQNAKEFVAAYVQKGGQ
jgi:ubiquitin-like protein Pup